MTQLGQWGPATHFFLDIDCKMLTQFFIHMWLWLNCKIKLLLHTEPARYYLTDRSWETERIVARWPSHPKFLLRLKRRFIYIIQFAKVIWSHDGHFGSFGHFLAPKMNFLPKAVMNYRNVSFWAKLHNK